ncbi:helix-turn-helix domain-containing protein [Desulforamulus aquiferis]|uniref:Helix-turn-helix transcriptional regulator n=1 Tax=Desulforamulus aquiferis TaxID=1397668 RepID=A0AAW7ZBT2_9FIRM|nr:helix-turn-helix transcriptional regulator [Desulforamulus aquiferis]MDO7786787.1 helix-turn-helix transcriptional regulator [Desulforamulus aquiferis]
MTISDRFKQLRETLGLTQTLMAKDLGIDRSHVGNIESASKKASESLIKHVCVRYGVSESWLNSGDGEMFISPEERVQKLIEQLDTQPSISSYYKFLADNNLPLQAYLPDHLQAQAYLLEQRKESIREEFEARLVSRISQTTDTTTKSEGSTLSIIKHDQISDTDLKELEDMKKTLADLFNASPSFREWAKIQFKYAFPEAVVAQARIQLLNKISNDKLK